jgi:hypothetical protein
VDAILFLQLILSFEKNSVKKPISLANLLTILKKTLRRKIEVIEIVVIDEIVTPIAAMLAGDEFVLPFPGGIVLTCHFSAPFIRKIASTI